MEHISESAVFEMMDAKRPRLEPEVLIKDLDTTKVSRVDLEERFSKHGKITDISMGRGSASIRYEIESSAYDAVRYEHRSLLKDSRIDVSMANKNIHAAMIRDDRGGDRDAPMMRGNRADAPITRGNRGDDRDAPMMRGNRGDDRDATMMRGGDRFAPMLRGDRSDDRIGPMMRGDRGGERVPPMMRGDRGPPMMRGDRGGDRGQPMMRGDRSGDRDPPVIRSDRDIPIMMRGDRDTPAMRDDRGGDKDGPMMRGDRGGDRNGPVMRGDRGGDRDGLLMKGDRGGDRNGPLMRGDRGGDRDGPMMRGDRDGPVMRGDRGGDRDTPVIRGDRGGDKDSPTRKERNFKEKPHDFHRFGRGNFPPDRDISPAKGFDNFRMSDRQNAAPHPPVQTQYSDYFDSQFPFKPNDCEIVVINKQQSYKNLNCSKYREYAESIEVRLKNIGFRVDVLFLKDEGLLINTVDDISHRGCLYAMIVSPPNEAHKSVTLDILHGMPQEHRDMPLDDALKLIARNFHEYLQRQREKADLNHMCYDPNGTFSGSDPEIRVLLKMLSDGQFLTLLELERIIGSLEKQKELLVAVSSKGTKPSLDSPGLQKEQMPNLHQMELQPNAFTANQIQFNPAALLGNSNESASMHPQEDNMLNSSFINFNSPNVKQALDNLIQSGPGLLKNIVNPTVESGDESKTSILSDIDLGITPDIVQSLSTLGSFTGSGGGLGHNRNAGNDQPFLGSGPITNNLFGIMPRKF